MDASPARSNKIGAGTPSSAADIRKDRLLTRRGSRGTKIDLRLALIGSNNRINGFTWHGERGVRMTRTSNRGLGHRRMSNPVILIDILIIFDHGWSGSFIARFSSKPTDDSTRQEESTSSPEPVTHSPNFSTTINHDQPVNKVTPVAIQHKARGSTQVTEHGFHSTGNHVANQATLMKIIDVIEVHAAKR